MDSSTGGGAASPGADMRLLNARRAREDARETVARARRARRRCEPTVCGSVDVRASSRCAGDSSASHRDARPLATTARDARRGTTRDASRASRASFHDGGASSDDDDVDDDDDIEGRLDATGHDAVRGDDRRERDEDDDDDASRAVDDVRPVRLHTDADDAESVESDVSAGSGRLRGGVEELRVGSRGHGVTAGETIV